MFFVFEAAGEWLRTASARDIITTAIAIVSSIWGLIERFVLAPARRRADKAQIDRLSRRLSEGHASAERSAAEMHRLQHEHRRELDSLRWQHDAQMNDLKLKHDNLSYQIAREAGRQSVIQDQMTTHHKQIIEAISVAFRSNAPLPVTTMASHDVVVEAVKDAERAAADLPVVGLQDSPSVRTESQVDDPHSEIDEQLASLIPPNPTLPSYMAHQPRGYLGMKLVRDVAYVDEEILSTAVQRLSEKLRTYVPKNGSTVPGDKITITGNGFVAEEGGWVAFEGGKLERFSVVIGSDVLIPGFEEQLTGLAAGQRKILELAFPDDYHATELAGREVIFKVSVDSVEEGRDFPLTDESVKSIGFDDLHELLSVLKRSAEADLELSSRQRLKRRMLDQLDEANKFTAPQDLVENELEALWRAQLQELRMRQLPLEALGKSPEQAREDLRPLAARRVRLGIVMTKLAAAAAQDGVMVSDDDVDNAVREKIAAAGENEAQVAAHYAIEANKESLRGPLLEDKVTEWILSKATIEDNVVPGIEMLKELM